MNNVIYLKRIRTLKDPAVIAWLKVRASGEDDNAYEFAIDLFERAIPTTRLGLRLKMRLLHQREAYGDEVTEEGRLMYARYRETLNVRVV